MIRFVKLILNILDIIAACLLVVLALAFLIIGIQLNNLLIEILFTGGFIYSVFNLSALLKRILNGEYGQ